MEKQVKCVHPGDGTTYEGDRQKFGRLAESISVGVRIRLQWLLLLLLIHGFTMEFWPVSNLIRPQLASLH
jgi:hypothetical protein